MKCVIRIRGNVGLNRDVAETLKRLNLPKKYSCIILNPSKIEEGMIKKASNFVAFGNIDEKTAQKILEKRGKKISSSKDIDFKKVLEGISKGSSLRKEGMIPFLALHPPRGGIKSKLHFPEGVLGNHGREINKLVERML